jgi:hypothetical protein
LRADAFSSPGGFDTVQKSLLGPKAPQVLISPQKLQLGGVLAEVNDDLERAVRSLTVELADLKATLAEVRLAFATDRTQALELPNPLSKRAGLN